MLDIVASYHCMEFHGKLTTQTQENGKKTNFGPDLDLLGPNSGRHFFFFFSKIWIRQLLDIKVNYHRIQYQEKLITQS